jgi:flagellar biosynthesis protein FliP
MKTSAIAAAMMICLLAAASYAQNENAALTMPSITGQQQLSPVNNAMPDIGELMKFVEKATAEGTEGQDAKNFSTPIKLVIIFAGLAILPSLLVMMTSFTRIVIVLSFVRKALQHRQFLRISP